MPITLALLLLAAPDAAPVEAAATLDPPREDHWLDAWAFSDEAYRLRGASADADGRFGGFDHDARWLFDTGARALDGRLGLDVSGALFWDIDGASPPGLASVHDARGPVDFFVDTLELRASHDVWLRRASVGRLTVQEGWPTTLDGAALALAPIGTSELTWIVFGSAGRTVHFFEVGEEGDDWFEDWAASIGSDVIVDQRLKLQVDYRALLEDGPPGIAQAPTHSYGAAFWARVDEVAMLQLFGRGLDDAVSHVGARTHAAWLRWAPWSFGVDGELVQQVATLGEIVEGQDPFFAILGPSLPHVRGFVDAYAGRDLDVLTATLHLGASGRQRLAGAGGPFNRNAARVYAAADADDVDVGVVDGLFASAIASYDLATDADDLTVLALGGAVGWSTELFRLRAGTSWDRVKYTYYRDVTELTDVRTIFAGAQWRPLRALRIGADYRVEIADRVVHTAQLGLAHDLDGAL